VTPHPPSFLGHPLPTGEGWELLKITEITALSRGERVAKGRVRGHFDRSVRLM